jgi:hypothetical protein
MDKVGKIECGSPARDFFAVNSNAQSAGGTPHRAMTGEK